MKSPLDGLTRYRTTVIEDNEHPDIVPDPDGFLFMCEDVESAINMKDKAGSKEIERVVWFQNGDVNCLRCRKQMTLYFNGGELDQHECCGLLYKTEHVRIDLVITEIAKDGGKDGTIAG